MLPVRKKNLLWLAALLHFHVPLHRRRDPWLLLPRALCRREQALRLNRGSRKLLNSEYTRRVPYKAIGDAPALSASTCSSSVDLRESMRFALLPCSAAEPGGAEVVADTGAGAATACDGGLAEMSVTQSYVRALHNAVLHRERARTWPEWEQTPASAAHSCTPIPTSPAPSPRRIVAAALW